MRYIPLVLIGLALTACTVGGDELNAYNRECAAISESVGQRERCTLERIRAAQDEGYTVENEGLLYGMMARRIAIGDAYDDKKIAEKEMDTQMLQAQADYSAALEQHYMERRQVGMGMMLGGAALMQASQPTYSAPAPNLSTTTTCNPTVNGGMRCHSW